jgi:hypothetical protein
VMGTLGRTGIPGFFIGNTPKRSCKQLTHRYLLSSRPDSCRRSRPHNLQGCTPRPILFDGRGA